MTGKAKSISYGGAYCNYICGMGSKEDAEKITFIGARNMDGYMMPDEVAMLIQTHVHDRRPRIENYMIQVVISPAIENTDGFTVEDWNSLWDDFTEEFDKIEMRNEQTGRVISKPTNIRGSKCWVWLHEDSESGIPHLHAAICRVDEKGNTNNDHNIHKRAQQAAAAVARKRGWKTAGQVRESALNVLRDECFDILRSMESWSFDDYIDTLQMRGYDVKVSDDKQGIHRGYVIRKGNCKYKSSDIHRSLTASRLQHTWEKLHNVNTAKQKPATSLSDMPGTIAQESTSADKPKVPTAYDYLVEKPGTVPYPFTFFGKTVDFYIPEDVMSIFETEFSEDDCANSAELTQYAAALFVMLIGGEDTVMTGGGGDTSNDSDWGRDPNEDNRNWAKRCAKMAVSKIGKRPRYRFKR